ncbi:hypothetical protein BGZ94_003815 [Podila epigama]|nr:hypothetical protein BGZ94_003815 [Podila epigama]
MVDPNSFSGTFDSRPSARSSTSSSVSNWAPRARSASVSSQGSTGSVNLDAIIASETDLNEEQLLEFVEEDDSVEWANKDLRHNSPDKVVDMAPVSEPVSNAHHNSKTPEPVADYGLDNMDDDWIGSISENEIGDDEDDEEFGEALREFSQHSLKTNTTPRVRGLSYTPSSTSSSRSLVSPTSTLRFASKSSSAKHNPFDLDVDYMETPAGLDGLRPASRSLQYGSSRSNVRNVTTPTSESRLAAPRSGLRPPGAMNANSSSTTSRLSQPGTRSALAQPRSASSSSLAKPTATGLGSRTGLKQPSGLQAPKSGLQAPKSGLQAPRSGLQAPRSGLQAPRTGLQTPKTGLQAPRANSPPTMTSRSTASSKPGSTIPSRQTSSSSLTTARTSLAKPTTPAGARQALSPSGLPGPGRVGSSSKLTTPVGTKRPNIPTSTSNRQSLLQAPASFVPRTNGSVSASVARINATTAAQSNLGPNSPRRGAPSGLVSPSRGMSIRQPSSSNVMVSPTSSQSSTSSLTSLGYSVRDSSQKLVNATRAGSASKSMLTEPRSAAGKRSVSMYGSSLNLNLNSGGLSLARQRRVSYASMEDEYEDKYYGEEQDHHQHQQQDYHQDYAVLTPPQSPSASKPGPRLSLMVPPTTTSRLSLPTATATSTTSSRIGRPNSPAALRGSQIPSGLVSPRAGASHHRY